jgi:hypothetical protein
MKGKRAGKVGWKVRQMGWWDGIGWSVTYGLNRNTGSPNSLPINHLQNMAPTVSTPNSTLSHPESGFNPFGVVVGLGLCLGSVSGLDCEAEGEAGTWDPYLTEGSHPPTPLSKSRNAYCVIPLFRDSSVFWAFPLHIPLRVTVLPIRNTSLCEPL